MKSQIQAVILAAGASARFGTGQSKQIAPLCGWPLVMHSIAAVQALRVPIITVLGHQAEVVSEAIFKHTSSETVTVVLQDEQRGTGHAVACAQAVWQGDHILILNGDMPLITPNLLAELLQMHIEKENALTFIAAQTERPHGYGRVLSENNSIVIKEEKECTDQERQVTTVNAGVYVVERLFLEHALRQLDTNNQTGEVYLTDIVAIASKAGMSIGVLEAPFVLVQGVNNLADLANVEYFFLDRVRSYWLGRGVRLSDPASISIDVDAVIGKGTVLGRGVHVLGNTRIGEGVTVEPYCVLTNAQIDNGATIFAHSVINHSTIAADAKVGPFAHVRAEAVVGHGAVVGNFVEVKKSVLAAGVKAKHLSYLGDARIGKESNIGAGVITCNYDGKHKHATIIGEHVMVGANSNLVAPVTIADDAYVAAGSTITRDVPSATLAISRARQEHKGRWSAGEAASQVAGERAE